MCTLDADRSLLRPFLRFAGTSGIPSVKELCITEQQVPGEYAPEDEEESRGLPDGCVFTEAGWALLIEAKVQDKARTGQLRRHVQTARRHGFDAPYVLLLTVDKPPSTLPERCCHRTWREIYAWFGARSNTSEWAATLLEYMRAFEAKMIARKYGIRGTITMYDGLRFDGENPFTYREAKRLIRLLGDELQARPDLRKLGIDTDGQRRSAITGRQGTRVWDFLPLKAAADATNFTEFPHLSFGLSIDRPVAAVTIPNGVRGGFRTKLKQVGVEGFMEVLKSVSACGDEVRKRSDSARLFVNAVQRHYKSQRSQPEVDATLHADLLTLLPGSTRGVKHQPQWIESIYNILTSKRSNIQLSLEFRFSYGCPLIRSRKSLDLFAAAWKAMFPIVDFAIED